MVNQYLRHNLGYEKYKLFDVLPTFGLTQKSFSRTKSVTKIIGKTAIWTISCSYPLPPLKNVEKQRAKLASSHVMGSQQCIEGEGDF